MIDKATVQRIKDAADIVEVVSDYVHLTRRGSNYMGLCPFHNERTPSFSVNKRRNFCYCFSCHKGGSPVNFIMEKEGISYHDALLQLAAKYGIEVHERELTDEERDLQNERDSMFTANKWAMEQMSANLTETDEGKDVGLQYFYQRGLTDEAIRAFHLGYAIDRGNALATSAHNAGYDQNVLVKLGVLGKSQDGRIYDRFRGRVIFPVFTTSGKVVAFGGRTLKGDKAKYINSPESEIYKKSNELYGIYQAKNSIVREDKCFLVEGYMDVIGMWQSGLQNVVASSGTALTDGQIAMIHRFTSNVTLIYDGDNAGIHAALRGIDMLLSHRLNVKVLLLPDGHDPDSFAKAHTPDEFRQYIADNETDIIRFKTKVLLNASGNDPQQRSAAIHSIVESLACIPDNIARNVYIGECARLLGVEESLIAVETRRARAKAVNNASRTRTYTAIDATDNTTPSDTQQTQPAAQTAQAAQTNEPANTNTQASRRRLSPQDRRLQKCEEEVLRYCVRYGMLYFCEGIDGNGETVPMNINQYVRSELGEDNMAFSVEAYRKVFEELDRLSAPFNEAFAEFAASKEPEYEEMRTSRYAELSEKQLSLAEMQNEEQQLEQAIAEKRNADLAEFAMIWPGQQLANDEDNDVRTTATRLLTEKYMLSRVYSRNGAHVADESERLGELIPRALDEWKDSILQQRQQDLRKQLADASAAGDTAAVSQLQQELLNLIAMRSQVARNIGDRIISAT